MIIETLKRESSFSRAASSSDKNHELHKQHEQLVAVNFDYVFIMQSLNNNFNLHRIERYLTLSYIKLQNEARYNNDSESYLNEKREKFKNIAKINKNNKKKW